MALVFYYFGFLYLKYQASVHLMVAGFFMSRKTKFNTKVIYSKELIAEKILEQAFAYILNLNTNSKNNGKTKGDELSLACVRGTGQRDSVNPQEPRAEVHD